MCSRRLIKAHVKLALVFSEFPYFFVQRLEKVFLFDQEKSFYFLPERVSIEPKKMQKNRETKLRSIIKTSILLFLTAKQSCQKMLTLWGQTIFSPCFAVSKDMPTI